MPVDNRTYLHANDKNTYRLVDSITLHRLTICSDLTFDATLKKLTFNVKEIKLDSDIGNSELIFATVRFLNGGGDSEIILTNTTGSITSMFFEFTNETKYDNRYNIVGLIKIGMRYYTGNEGIANVYYRPYLINCTLALATTIPTKTGTNSNIVYGRTIETDYTLASGSRYYFDCDGIVALVPLKN